ncbi:MAG: metal ABC transporter permease, partial [Planctomycetota bacterium]
GTLALVTVAGLPAVGVVLMAALLILPGATARFWTDRLGPLLLLSGILGALTGATGTLLSSGVLEDWIGFDPLALGYAGAGPPTGPVIVLCGTAIFLFSVFFAPGRGAIARLWARLRLRWKTARENLLRTLYELSEPQLPNLPEISIDELLERRAWSRSRVRKLAGWLVRAGLGQRGTGGIRLTRQGLTEAGRLVRAHRLWELFLIQGADIAPDHVDRDADSIEHLLSPEMVRLLEADLAAAGRLPELAVPHSPHETVSNAEGRGQNAE